MRTLGQIITDRTDSLALLIAYVVGLLVLYALGVAVLPAPWSWLAMIVWYAAVAWDWAALGVQAAAVIRGRLARRAAIAASPYRAMRPTTEDTP